MSNEEVQVDLLFLGDIIALHAMDMYTKSSLLPPSQSENPGKVWGAFCGGWSGIFSPPKCIQMDEDSGGFGRICAQGDE